MFSLLNIVKELILNRKTATALYSKNDCHRESFCGPAVNYFSPLNDPSSTSFINFITPEKKCG